MNPFTIIGIILLLALLGMTLDAAAGDNDLGAEHDRDN